MQDADRRKDQVQVFRVGAAETPSRNTIDWQPATDIRVYLVVSRFETDHALTYLFCQGSQDLRRLQRLVDERRDQFRGSNVVVELGERFGSLAQARQRALGLRTWLTNVNIVFPPIQLP